MKKILRSPYLVLVFGGLLPFVFELVKGLFGGASSPVFTGDRSFLAASIIAVSFSFSFIAPALALRRLGQLQDREKIGIEQASFFTGLFFVTIPAFYACSLVATGGEFGGIIYFLYIPIGASLGYLGESIGKGFAKKETPTRSLAILFCLIFAFIFILMVNRHTLSEANALCAEYQVGKSSDTFEQRAKELKFEIIFKSEAPTHQMRAKKTGTLLKIPYLIDTSSVSFCTIEYIDGRVTKSTVN